MIAVFKCKNATLYNTLSILGKAVFSGTLLSATTCMHGLAVRLSGIREVPRKRKHRKAIS